MNVPPTMRALQQTSSNGPRDLRVLNDAPVPVPGRGEVLLEVAASGINFADVSMSYGVFSNGPAPPYLAGFEAVGQVVALGEGVSSPELGALVVGVAVGAFAEYALLRAASALRVPEGWSARGALGLVVNWPTALAALKPMGRLIAGETVLIHAAAGATGQAALALAKRRGAKVIATASPSKHEVVRALGADHVLDSRSADLAAQVLNLTDGRGADVVLESSGGASFEASLAAARRVTGRVVVFGLAGGEASLTNWQLVYEHQVHVIGLNIGVLIQAAPHVYGQIMSELMALIATGAIAPAQPTIYDLADGAKALADLENRTTVGKLALVPRP